MAKRIAPQAGYWIGCLDSSNIPWVTCCKTIHDLSCVYLDVYKTDGTLKNMKYIHHEYGTGWCTLYWTCFPFDEIKNGTLKYYPTLADLKTALGTHKINGMI